MGEVITATQISPPAVPVPVAPGTPLPSPNNGFTIDIKDIKEMLSLVSEGIKNFKEIAQMRNQQQVPITQAVSGAEPVPISTQKKVEYVIDRKKLKAFLSDVIINQARKIPEDIQNKKLSELIGENFQKFNYKFKGMVNINSEFLIDTLTEQVANQVDTMLEVKK